jgi:hypothetical protein
MRPPRAAVFLFAIQAAGCSSNFATDPFGFVCPPDGSVCTGPWSCLPVPNVGNVYFYTCSKLCAETSDCPQDTCGEETVQSQCLPLLVDGGTDAKGCQTFDCY